MRSARAGCSLSKPKPVKYTMRLYRGRKLVAETTWDLNEVYMDEIVDEAEALIEEAIETNDGPKVAEVDQGV